MLIIDTRISYEHTRDTINSVTPLLLRPYRIYNKSVIYCWLNNGYRN